MRVCVLAILPASTPAVANHIHAQLVTANFSQTLDAHQPLNKHEKHTYIYIYIYVCLYRSETKNSYTYIYIHIYIDDYTLIRGQGLSHNGNVRAEMRALHIHT